ncbi:hypothetical protein B5S28_g3648 [[Candida] boidinii]|nr:hypothetical protein B5S28_g3648 [[Candida] boidinii]OWB78223.1 hypothetical protein B5S32_g2411 [[Candida] boidinii]
MQQNYESLRLLDNSKTMTLVGRKVPYPKRFNDPNLHKKPKKYPIESMSDPREQEAAIMFDLMSVLLGFEGFYIRYSEAFDPEDLTEKLTGPDFKLHKFLDSSLKDITRRILGYGKKCFALRSFVEMYDNTVYGKLIGALCYEIDNLLKEYQILIARIQRQFKDNSNYSLSKLEQELKTGISTQFDHLYYITQKIKEENEKRTDFETLEQMNFQSIIKSIKHDLVNTGGLDDIFSNSESSRFVKGGMVLNLIDILIDENEGNGSSYHYLLELHNSVASSFVEMLNLWLENGILQDPFDEFMIRETVDMNLNSKSEQFWTEKFTIRSEGALKQFASSEMQYKILLTGKYLNLLKECGIDMEVYGTELDKIKTLYDPDLYIKIDQAYGRANKYIVELLFQGYNIKEFILGLNKYFLLTNNHNMNDFLNHTIHDFKRPRNMVSLTGLTKQFDISYSADDSLKMSPLHETIRLIFKLINVKVEKDSYINELMVIINSRITDAQEVFESGDLNSLKKIINSAVSANVNSSSSNGSSSVVLNGNKIDGYAIQRFTFDIEIPFPLNLILTRTFVAEYQIIFRNLMFIRYIEKSMEISWKEIGYQKFWTYRFSSKKLRRWIKNCRVLHSRMSDFIRVLSYYINFQVIDSNRIKLEKILDKFSRGEGECELRELFEVLKSFSNTILHNSLLTKVNVLAILYHLLCTVVLFHNFIMSLRKTLILMDEDLYERNRSRMADKEFDEEKNKDRLERIFRLLYDYNNQFNSNVTELIECLKYYGQFESPSFLTLFDDLVALFPEL